jgi:two-component system chemotaxis response regulator CheB
MPRSIAIRFMQEALRSESCVDVRRLLTAAPRTVDTPLAYFATIVIGASTGGVEALRTLVSGLPRDIPAAICVVQHIGHNSSMLPELLAQVGTLPVAHARQGEVLRPGKIYVAPPDHHLLLMDGFTRLTRGPRENWARPAIDPLFRSAADIYGPRVVGVVLTGGLNDGTAGLHAVREAGGIAVVQHPADAACADMPASALRHAGANYCVPLRDIPQLLYEIANDITSKTPLRMRAGGHTDD